MPVLEVKLLVQPFYKEKTRLTVHSVPLNDVFKQFPSSKSFLQSAWDSLVKFLASPKLLAHYQLAWRWNLSLISLLFCTFFFMLARRLFNRLFEVFHRCFLLLLWFANHHISIFVNFFWLLVLLLRLGIWRSTVACVRIFSFCCRSRLLVCLYNNIVFLWRGSGSGGSSSSLFFGSSFGNRLDFSLCSWLRTLFCLHLSGITLLHRDCKFSSHIYLLVKYHVGLKVVNMLTVKNTLDDFKWYLSGLWVT